MALRFFGLDARRPAAAKDPCMVLLAALLAVSAPPAAGPAQPVIAARMAPRPGRRRPGLSVRIPDAAPSIALPTVQGPDDPRRPLVVIDAGHGGHDPGAGNAALNLREKDVTLALAIAIRDELLKTGRIRVALTRGDDRFLVLQERYGIARQLGARLFISVHADAAEAPSAHGATVYTLSDVASDREAARLAARENRSDVIDGVDLSGSSSTVGSILIDLTQRETMEASSRFADLLHREAVAHFPFRDPPHRFASLVVLKSPDTPSVLFEAGYLSNDQDARWLASRDGQLQVAKGVAAAVSVHFARASIGR